MMREPICHDPACTYHADCRARRKGGVTVLPTAPHERLVAAPARKVTAHTRGGPVERETDNYAQRRDEQA